MKVNASLWKKCIFRFLCNPLSIDVYLYIDMQNFVANLIGPGSSSDPQTHDDLCRFSVLNNIENRTSVIKPATVRPYFPISWE